MGKENTPDGQTNAVKGKYFGGNLYNREFLAEHPFK